MAERKLKDAVVNGEKVYFRNHAKATFMSSGETVENAVCNVSSAIPTKVSDLDNDADFAPASAIPTKVSQLDNDSSYATVDSVPTKVSELENDKSYVSFTKVSELENDADYATVSQVPTKVSDLENDSDFATNESVGSAMEGYLPLSGGTIKNQTESNPLTLSSGASIYMSFVSDAEYDAHCGLINYNTIGYAASFGLEKRLVVPANGDVGIMDSHNGSMNVLFHSGNLSGDALTSLLDFYEGANTATSVAGIPVTKRLCVSTISASGSFSLASVPATGREVHVMVNNSGSSDVTVALPNTGNYVCLVNTALNVKAGGYTEINVISDGSKMYIRSVG